jgi:GST-like protein
MIDLYFFTTANGYKARLMLEEMALPYTIHLIALPKSQHLSDAYRNVSPSHKIPTIIDSDGPDGGPVTIIESGAILRYLAAKTGSPLLPSDPVIALEMEQWFHYALSTFAMTLTQLGTFLGRFPEDLPSVKKFYGDLALDHYQVIDNHLSGREYFAGDYSLADIAHYTYVRNHEVHQIPLGDFPEVKRWFEAISERPAVSRAYQPVAG